MANEIAAPLLRAERLLDLVPFLHSHQGISLIDLASHFQVTKQQMVSDLTTLWMCGLPGYTPLELMELDFDSGFVTIRNAPTLSKPRNISFDESLALLLGLDLLINSLPVEREDLLIIAKNLSQRIKDRVGVKTVLQASPKELPNVVGVIHQAIRSREGLRISYHSLYRDFISERDVSVVDLYEKESHLYLRAYCSTAKDFREFRVDRILAISLIESPNVPNSSISSDTGFQYSLRVKSPSRDLVERFGISELGEDLTLSSYSQQWVERSVLSCGSAVALIEPESLRREIASTAQVILDRYISG